MALIALLKFVVASGSLYLAKELGLFDNQRRVMQINKLEPIQSDKNPIKESKLVKFNRDNKEDSKHTTNCSNTDKDSKCVCKPEPNTWGEEFEKAWNKSMNAIQTVPGHWRRLTQSIQESIQQFFKSDK